MYNIRAFNLQVALFTCLHTEKINEKPLIGKNYRLNSSSWGRTKNYGFSDVFSANQHKNFSIFMSSILVCWVSNALMLWYSLNINLFKKTAWTLHIVHASVMYIRTQRIHNSSVIRHQFVKETCVLFFV